MTTRVPFQSIPLDQHDVMYEYGPDSFAAAGLARGTTTQFTIDDSAVFPGTSRQVWVHVPQVVERDGAEAMTVFNDGWWYLDPDGDVRAAVVLDNLTRREEIPRMVGVFVDPGMLDDGTRKNRNIEYDAFDDRYATFLATEVIPEVERRVSKAFPAECRAICGGSSGGNAAFTAAWMRPDVFSKVIGFLSSFAQMPGGNTYPELINSVTRKPLRILLQAGHRDLNWNEPSENWLAENLRVAAALAEAGYDFRLVLGDGPHSPNHGGVLLPDALRWVWR